MLNLVLTQFPSSVYHNARINISFPQGFGINFEDVVVGVMKNGVPLNGKAIVTMDSNLRISWRNDGVAIHPSEIVYIQLFGIINAGIIANAKIFCMYQETMAKHPLFCS